VSPDASERLTVAEAARRLGISQDAVRKRIKRRSIRYERGEGGRVYVYLDASETEQDTDRGRVQDHTAELIATLREQLEQANERDRENRRIIAALTSRIPAIEAPQEAPEPPSEATPQPGRVEPQPAASKGTQAQESHEMHMPSAGGGPQSRDQQEATERPWWRFWR
jgi:excisionase family DNA binding protein